MVRECKYLCADLVLNSTRQCQNLFLACWQSSFSEFALQQLPKQSQWAECRQCWDSKSLILGQDIRHSFSFHVFTETLFSFYVTSHVFEWATTTDCLGLHRLKCGLQYHSTSCYLEQMETVQLGCEEVPPTVTTAPCLQSVTVCWLDSVCLTTSRPHIWSTGQCWLRTSISSWFFNTPPPQEELKEGREGEKERETGRGRFNEQKSPMEWANHGIWSAPVWNDSFPDLSTEIWPEILSHAIIASHPTI